jgi:hypothetical protein
VISGDTRYFVPGYGLFDYKGVNELGDFYQQQTTHTRQYKGWNAAAEYTNDSGYILQQKEIDGKLEWVLPGIDEFGNVVDKVVTPQAVSGVVFPYSPAVTEKYGNTAVRDLTLSGLCAHAPISQFAAASGGFASGFFAAPDVRRQMVPYNGTSGDQAIRTKGIKVTATKNNFVENASKWEQTYIEGEAYYSRGTTQYKLEQGVKLEWQLDDKPLNYSRRSGDVFSWLMLAADPEVEAEHTVSGSGEGAGESGFYGGWYEEPDILLRDSYTTEFSNISEKTTKFDDPTILMFYIAGAPDAERGKQHQLWTVLRWTGGGATSQYTDCEKQTITEVTPGFDGPDTTQTIVNEYERSGIVSFTPNEFTFVPSRISVGDDMQIEPQSIIVDASTFTANLSKYHDDYEYDDDSGEWKVTTTVELMYELTVNIRQTYTRKGDSVVEQETVAAYTRKETSPGRYEGVLPSVSISGEITDMDELNALVNTVKEDVSGCELPATDTVGDYANGRWEWRGEREEIKIETN